MSLSNHPLTLCDPSCPSLFLYGVAGLSVGEQMEEGEWIEFELGPYGAHRWYPVHKLLLSRQKQRPQSEPARPSCHHQP